MTITVRAHPSLALIKYWGKSDVAANLPATSSLAVGLEALYTETRLSVADGEDSISLEGILQPKERYAPFFDHLRQRLRTASHFCAESRSNFPSAAGLASSSSGFAALAYGCAKLIDETTSLERISDIARQGSASAARAVFGGFTLLEKGQASALPLFDASHWPELRVLIAIVKNSPKSVSSREAMERSKRTSPFYTKWLNESDKTFANALEALKEKNLNALGPLIQQSYLQMFSTMFTSVPPIFYWEPDSIRILHACERLRKEGYAIWETMDAGPQVKMLCLDRDVEFLKDRLSYDLPELDYLITKIGGSPKILEL